MKNTSLLLLARQFEALQPWRSMGDREMFAIQDPETGEIYYNVVMGVMGTLFGLASYPGADGYACYRYAVTNKGELSEYDDWQYLHHSILTTFEHPKDMPPHAEQDYRGSALETPKNGTWPIMMAYDPELLPSPITEQQAQSLEHIFTQSIFVVERYLQTGITEFRRGRKILTRVPTRSTDGIEWRDEWITPPSAPESKAMVHLSDAKSRQLRQALTHPRSGLVFELDYFIAPTPIVEPGTRGFFPRVLLVIEPRSSFIAGSHMCDGTSFGEDLADILIQATRELGTPAEIHVRRSEIEQALQPICASQGTTVRLQRSLPEFSQAKRHFLDMMFRDFRRN